MEWIVGAVVSGMLGMPLKCHMLIVGAVVSGMLGMPLKCRMLIVGAALRNDSWSVVLCDVGILR